MTLLDIGGSTGAVALEFVNTFGYQAIVLDPAPDELQVATTKGLEVIQGFLETYDPGTRQFDLVLMCQTIDHLLSLRDSLTRIRELILKPTGYFFCDIVDFDEWCYLTGCVETALHLDHCYYLTQETAFWMFSSLGYEVIQADMAKLPGFVGYLLRPGEVDSSPPPDALARPRTIQRLQTKWRLASQHTYGIAHWLRNRAYRARQYPYRVYKQ